MNILQPFYLKELVIRSIREFFYGQNFHEVVVPVLNRTLPLEPNIYAFSTGKYFLPTSPESALKKMLSRGMGDCFAISPSFRNLEGKSKWHRPEFLMLEWYRENADYRKIMEDTEELFFYIKKKVDNYLGRRVIGVLSVGKNKIKISTPWHQVTMTELFARYAKIDLLDTLTMQKMEIAARQKGYDTKNANFEKLFNQIFLNEIEPSFSREPFFLCDFPARISPLCAVKTNMPEIAERFEVYIGGMELGNGNTENTDYKSVEKAFREEEKNRQAKGEICPPVDYVFIETLKKMQGKSYAGIGLGVDRLTMILGNIDNINQLT